AAPHPRDPRHRTPRSPGQAARRRRIARGWLARRGRVARSGRVARLRRDLDAAPHGPARLAPARRQRLSDRSRRHGRRAGRVSVTEFVCVQWRLLQPETVACAECGETTCVAVENARQVLAFRELRIAASPHSVGGYFKVIGMTAGVIAGYAGAVAATLVWPPA